MQGVCTQCGRSRTIIYHGPDFQWCEECYEARPQAAQGKTIQLKDGRTVRLSGRLPEFLKLGGRVYKVALPTRAKL